MVHRDRCAKFGLIEVQSNEGIVFEDAHWPQLAGWFWLLLSVAANEGGFFVETHFQMSGVDVDRFPSRD